ncbi:MAG: hypothetical protein ACI3X1_00115, partial [Eubacteriales bacterium]
MFNNIHSLVNQAIGDTVAAQDNTFISLLTSGPAIIVYIALVLILVAVVIVMLMFSDSGESKKVEYKIVSGTLSGQTSSADKSGDNTVTERFCMLSEIDKNSTKYGHTEYE